MKCPCGSDKKYKKCCGLYHSGRERPQNALRLMRSRYSAYALGEIDYIAATMKGPAAKDFNAQEALRWSKACRWLGLKILRHEVDTNDPSKALVEFIAQYIQNNQSNTLHENSKFEFDGERWYYVDGHCQ